MRAVAKLMDQYHSEGQSELTSREAPEVDGAMSSQWAYGWRFYSDIWDKNPVMLLNQPERELIRTDVSLCRYETTKAKAVATDARRRKMYLTTHDPHPSSLSQLTHTHLQTGSGILSLFRDLELPNPLCPLLTHLDPFLVDRVLPSNLIHSTID